MPAPQPRAPRSGTEFRLLRAVAFATVCVALSAGGHLLASHGAVPVWSLGLGFLLTLAVAVPLSGRPRSAAAITGALAVGQLGLHCLFGQSQQMAAQSMADHSAMEQATGLLCGAGAVVTSPHQAYGILANAGLAPPTAGGHAHHMPDGMAPGAHLLPDLPMLLGHLLAALALGWLLRRGDLALTRVVELSVFSVQGIAEVALVRRLRAALALVRALRAGLPGAPGTVGHARRTLPDPPAKPRTTALAHTVIRRGPPADPFALAA
ncbi:hypothetical protein G6045_28650 [Streptomyces sp. YC504]|uniref:Integral membrane protein n=1 Tax=Streptomyces mesophilus TaxID=1775132 RepID=A0A6G4XPW6_9ACTN|nr:hypothetical protein [Streptomyces mesophilus]NGO79595.1 hypothetical protein [Streptomyces mesophilus]